MKFKKGDKVKISRPKIILDCISLNQNHSFGEVIKTDTDGTSKVKIEGVKYAQWENNRWLFKTD